MGTDFSAERRSMKAACILSAVLVLAYPGVARSSDEPAAAPLRPLPPPVGVAEPAPDVDPETRTLPPTASKDLEDGARHLFDAIASGRPELALDFFFPREPFLSLKDVADPGRYHDELVASYRRDILSLHGSRRSWDGAVFTGFELGTPPKWVPPGGEWKKIGYF